MGSKARQWGWWGAAAAAAGLAWAVVVFFVIEVLEEIVGEYPEALSGWFDQVVAAGPLVAFVVLPVALWCLAAAPEYDDRRGRLIMGATTFTLLWLYYLNTLSQSRLDDGWTEHWGTGFFLFGLAVLMVGIAVLTLASAGRWWARAWQGLQGRMGG